MASDELVEINAMLRSQVMAAMSLEEQRDVFEGSAGAHPDGTRIDAGGPDEVPCEWLVPTGNTAGFTILSLGGGGYCLGSLASNRRFSGLLAEVTGAKVLSVGYRRAPEHPFPAAIEDALAAYRWLVGTGIPASSIAVVGNSAGGGLALALLLALRDAGDALPGCAAAMSPWTDLALTGDSITSNAATEVMLDPIAIADTAAMYVDPDRATDPLASPLQGDLAGLPPVLLHASRAEILRDDSIRFAEKARAAGSDVTLTLVDDAPHVWHLFAGLLPEADDALDAVGRWITEQMEREPG